MPYTKVTDIAYGRLQAPSLDQQEEFLVNFGMVRVERTKDALYMRGTDPNHHLHVTHLGPEKFVGFAFFVENEDELKKFTKAPGATGIENIDEPGGGKRVRVNDIHGYQMEVICGLEQLPKLPTRNNVLNWGDEKNPSRQPADAACSRPVTGQAHGTWRADDHACARGHQVDARIPRPDSLG